MEAGLLLDVKIDPAQKQAGEDLKRIRDGVELLNARVGVICKVPLASA